MPRATAPLRSALPRPLRALGLAALPILGAVALGGCGEGLAPGDEDYAAEVSAAATIPGCPGAFGDADSYAGLPGLYVQPLPYAAPLTHLQVLTALPLDPARTTGQLLRTELGVTRAGRYIALESNPAIGPVLSIWDAGRQDPDLFFVLGVRRSSPARISALCLLPTRQDSKPFALLRSGL